MGNNTSIYLNVFNIPFTTANSEVKWQFPKGAKKFTMHTRNGSAVRIATQPGLVAGSNNPHFTLKANTSMDEGDFDIIDFRQTFYFACAQAGEVLEIIVGVENGN